MCLTFLFIDSFEDTTLNSSKFSKYYKTFPSDLPNNARLNLQSMKHGIIALQRALISKHQDNSLLDTIERIAGHSVTTGRMVYAVDDMHRTRSNIESQKFLLVSSKWQDAAGFAYIESISTQQLEVRHKFLLEGKNFNIQCTPSNLFEAGVDIYSKKICFLEELTANMHRYIIVFMCNISNSSTHGYGKTFFISTTLGSFKKKGTN